MTLLDPAPAAGALEPLQRGGWLRQSWDEQLAAASRSGAGSLGRHRYLWASNVPELVEPFVVRSAAEGAGRPGRVVWFAGLGHEPASALLKVLPGEAMQRNFSTCAPSPRVLLGAVAHGRGMLSCSGDLTSPAIPTGGLRVRSLTVHDADLLDIEPDLTAGDLPTWLDSLPARVVDAYLDGRRECLTHALVRQLWFRVATAYAITGARRPPTVSACVDAEGRTTSAHFAW